MNYTIGYSIHTTKNKNRDKLIILIGKSDKRDGIEELKLSFSKIISSKKDQQYHDIMEKAKIPFLV